MIYLARSICTEVNGTISKALTYCYEFAQQKPKDCLFFSPAFSDRRMWWWEMPELPDKHG